MILVRFPSSDAGFNTGGITMPTGVPPHIGLANQVNDVLVTLEEKQ